MKTRAHPFVVVAVSLLLLNAINASAATFFGDAFIGATDTSYDGDDIIVTNCTLTVDGVHGFNSLQILNGGVLTHSPNTYGPQEITFFVLDEPQIMSATNPATLDNTNVDTSSIVVMDASGTIVYTEDIDYVVTASNRFVELELTTNSSIADGATVLVNYEWFQTFQGFNLTISNSVWVATGGALDLSGEGYGGGFGFSTGSGTSQSTNYPFTFTAGSGAGHGGCGAMSSTFARGGAAYDSTTSPGTLGSGGGAGSNPGGSGGGVGQLTIGGTLEVDGAILADGAGATNAHSGGGAGGSLLISAQTVSGAGTISANGGNGETPDGGGGGGGRIAIYFATNNFSGNISAFGGSGANYGGAGTIYLQAFTDVLGQLLIANGGHRGTNTFFSPLSSFSIRDLTISGGAVAQSQLNASLAVSDLFVGSNSALVTPDSTPFVLLVTNNATIESNATINADFRSLSGSGNGGLLCNAGTGGGYGGFGGGSLCGRAGGGIYGLITRPLLPGSTGGGSSAFSRGGGVVNLTVYNTLFLNGKISADGASSTPRANGGGGSGGSIVLTVGTLSGDGTISASGGAANNLGGGGGGGGRIALYYSSNLFSGDILARGGAGTNAGGAGTVYLQGSNSLPQLIVDNGGLVGYTALPSALGFYNVTLTGGAVLTNFDGSTVTLSNLFIGSNSFLVATPPSVTMMVSNVTIQPGGGISVDGESPGGAGSGQTLFSTGGGGGNSGYGGMSASNALGGVESGSIISPATAGGNGGAGVDNEGLGGAGGGIINLTVSGTLQLDGQISANGVAGSGFNSGGGAGGSILLTFGTLAGSGTISTKGGAADNLGGGGGGGYIAIYYGTNSFAGTTDASGGAGANYGGAGTVFYSARPNFGHSFYQQLIVDNGGTRGTNTPLLALSGDYDLTVSGGAILNGAPQSLTLGNLFIGSNSTFLVTEASEAFLSVLSNATIQSGGVLNADGASIFGPDPGQTLNQTGGGGGYGGMGGASLASAAGGSAFSDSITEPSETGSHGGAGLNGVSGGNGGGELRITIEGTLQMDGVISANGAAGSALDSGGGSGGSLLLSVAKIFGAGVISANGGAGNGLGGGGGGGRIALTYNTSNAFAGSFSAHGGAGGNFGGAGTIYVASSTFQVFGPAPQLVLDNGGVRGAITPIFNYPTQTPFDLIITNGAALVETNYQTTFLTLRDLMIGSNSTYVPFSPSEKTITVETNVTIFAGGRINADGQSTSGLNPGQTLNATGGGGGHGGYGGSSISNAPGGGVSTDQITEPQALGSRGGSGFNNGAGGNGGGFLHLSVGNVLQVDGTISANGVGGAADSGAGSGGSVWLSTGRFAGAGTISANGGSADSVGGGGGGGRMAITWRSNSFSGALTARGGAGATFGGAGTIYTSGNPVLQGSGAQLVIDNGGVRGTNTLLSSSVQGANLIIDSGASVTLSGQSSPWNSLTIASNATVSPAPSTVLSLDIISNATIQPGGAIILDGDGYAANLGPGAGPMGSGTGGGGGHGGYGSASQTVLGGLNYDSISFPDQAGSGGGSSTGFTGSAGGGAMELTVGKILTVNGSISANGTPGIASGAGGGAGGALNLNAGSLSGSGTISADGAAGEFFGGGGGGAGGRIAVTFSSNQFTGTISAHGGAGFVLSGGAGTIYLKTNSIITPTVILDNGGNAGTNTPLGLSGPVALSVFNGAVATTISSPGQFQSLLIGNGGEFTTVPKTPLYLDVSGNAVINSGGAIVADFLGYDDATGPGAGSVDLFGNGSGGGYGGAGGTSIGGAPGGISYGSSNQPTSLGSPGGISPAIGGFSQGGGSIQFTVNGALTINGNISANGNNAFIDGSGGGSGGSIWITAGSLAGNGSLTANGGAGQDTEGGGGGGGRVAIYTSSNSFSGSILATGGAAGSAPGQNGTIYIGTNLIVSGSVTDTNGDAIEGIILSGTGTSSAMSDTNGLYCIPVPLFWSGTITPSGSGIIVPSSQSYSALSSNAPNQNFVVASVAAFGLSCAQCDGTNMTFGWYGINGASYQPLCSTDLVNWVPYGGPFPGSNSPVTLAYPVTNGPQLFFRLNVTY